MLIIIKRFSLFIVFLIIFCITINCNLALAQKLIFKNNKNKIIKRDISKQNQIYILWGFKSCYDCFSEILDTLKQRGIDTKYITWVGYYMPEFDINIVGSKLMIDKVLEGEDYQQKVFAAYSFDNQQKFSKSIFNLVDSSKTPAIIICYDGQLFKFTFSDLYTDKLYINQRLNVLLAKFVKST